MGVYTNSVRRQQDVRILDLHLAGKSARAIADDLHIGHATVSRRIAKLIDQFSPDAVQYRKTVTMRLERLLAKLEPGLDGDAQTRALTAGKILAALDQLRRLYGMDEPNQVEVIHLDPQDIELRQMIADVESHGKAATEHPATRSSTPQEKA